MATTGRGDGLLGVDDPPPVRITNPDGASSFLLVGDHAGVAIPAMLGSLGLAPIDLARHIACDIGVATLGRMLAERLDACFVEQVYSRLVVDCNRDENHADLIAAASDETAVPGNADLSAGARAARIAAIHRPYQAAIGAALAARPEAVLVSLHSFTPVMDGAARPWDVGVLHDGGDSAFALRLLNGLRAQTDIVTGDNQPYHMDATDHTVPRHAYAARRPYAEIEVRQDHLADTMGCAEWADRLAGALKGAL